MLPVTDNVSVKEIILYYKTIEFGSFKPLTIKRISGADQYAATVDDAREPGIEY